jgi:hypothetical protein
MNIHQRDMDGGAQDIWRFKNNYGASVIRDGTYACGGLELAVIKFNSESDTDWYIDHETTITGDVVRHLTEESLAQLLIDIEALEETK